jgi:hypothetical protein
MTQHAGLAPKLRMVREAPPHHSRDLVCWSNLDLPSPPRGKQGSDLVWQHLILCKRFSLQSWLVGDGCLDARLSSVQSWFEQTVCHQ